MVDSAAKALEDLLSRPDGSWTLTAGALAIARLDSPGIDGDRYSRALSELASEVRSALGDARHPRFVCGSLSATLFDRHGFTCESRKSLPEHFFLHRVLDQRIASPALMALIICEVARLSGFRFEPVALPGELLLRRDAGNTPFLFLPAQRCRPVDIDECREIVHSTTSGRVEFTEGFLRPITSSQLLARIVAGLKELYWHGNRFEDALGTVRLMLCIRPDDPREIRDRGRLLFLLGRFSEAIRSFESYLAHNPRGEDADVVRMLIQEARAGLSSGGR